MRISGTKAGWKHLSAFPAWVLQAGSFGWSLVFLTVGLSLGVFVHSEYVLIVLVTFLLYCLYTTALNVIMGAVGLFAITNPAFGAIGAFVSAALVIRNGWSYWLALLAALIVAAAVALVIGYVALRSTTGIYLGVVTMGVVGLIELAGKLPPIVPFTGGVNGLSTTYLVTIGSFKVDSFQKWYFVLLFMLLLVTFTVYRLITARTGRAWVALKDNEHLARSLGVPPMYCKLLAFVISSSIAALAGGLYAPIFKFISVTNFDLEAAIQHILILVLGGLGSMVGPFIGSAIFIWVPELLRPIEELRLIVFGAILIVVIVFSPGGIASFLRRFLTERVGDTLQGQNPFGGDAGEVAYVDGFRVSDGSIAGKRPGPILLEGRAIDKEFGGLLALSDVSIELRQGEILGLIGPNGAGKTTLFQILSGFEKPTSGRVLLNGEDITNLPPERIAVKGLVRTFQEVKVFRDLTVLEHILVARYLRGTTGILVDLVRGRRARQVDESNMRQAAFLLKTCGLQPQWNHLGKNLAYGQMKKLCIAMALATEPAVLLLDEPAAGLSVEEADTLSAVIGDVCAAGVSIVLVEHNVSFVSNLAHRIIALDLGKKVADGTPDEVVSHPQVVTAYLGAVPC